MFYKFRIAPLVLKIEMTLNNMCFAVGMSCVKVKVFRVGGLNFEAASRQFAFCIWDWEFEVKCEPRRERERHDSIGLLPV
jgi:hypothetical protein